MPIAESPAATGRVPPRTAGWIAGAVALLAVGLDLIAPANLIVPIVYGVPLVFAAWVRDLRFLWGTAAALVAATFLPYWLGRSVTVPDAEMIALLNRFLSALVTLLVAGLLHGWVIADKAADANRTLLTRQTQALDALNHELEQYEEETDRLSQEFRLQAAELARQREALRLAHEEQERQRAELHLAGKELEKQRQELRFACAEHERQGEALRLAHEEYEHQSRALRLAHEEQERLREALRLAHEARADQEKTLEQLRELSRFSRDAPGALTGLRILLIENHAAPREDTVQLLQAEQAIVLEALNGRDGLRALQEEVVDVLLLDLMLPDLDGREVLRALQAQRPAGLRAVLVMTDDLTPERLEEVKRLGADALIGKPIDVHKLVATLRGLRSTEENG